MKYIIELPEDVYKRTIFYKEFHDLSDCVTTIKAIENGTPLEEELEKIKTEIETKCKVCCLPRIIAECNISKSNREWCEYYYCLKIINEHIAELKGETK